METTLRILFLSIASALSTEIALAHGGHVGELAGHSHWLGWAALAGAAGLAALLAKAKLGKKNNEQSGETSDEPSDGFEVEVEQDDNVGEAA